MLDQRLLPHREVIRTYRDYRGVAGAIQTMVIRGAPAIGMALAIRGNSGPHARARFDRAATLLKATRPTAVNLAWAVERMGRVLKENLELDPTRLYRRMRDEAIAIFREDLAANRMLGR